MPRDGLIKIQQRNHKRPFEEENNYLPQMMQKPHKVNCHSCIMIFPDRY